MTHISQKSLHRKCYLYCLMLCLFLLNEWKKSWRSYTAITGLQLTHSDVYVHVKVASGKSAMSSSFSPLSDVWEHFILKWIPWKLGSHVWKVEIHLIYTVKSPRLNILCFCNMVWPIKLEDQKCRITKYTSCTLSKLNNVMLTKVNGIKKKAQSIQKLCYGLAKHNA